MYEILYAVLYNAGAYGNFISWLSKWATNDAVPINQRPWGKQGNAHYWEKTVHLTVEDACRDPQIGSLFHPRKFKDDDLNDLLSKFLTTYDKLILLYPSKNDIIWNINNKEYKTEYQFGWINEFITSTNTTYLNLWDNQKNELWALREWLSFFLLDQHLHEVDFNTCQSLQNEKILKIPMCEIKNNFRDTLNNISKFIEKPIIRSDEEIFSLYKEWLSKQEHINKDELVRSLITSILNNENKEMINLTIVDQAEIQRSLRDDYGYEIKCYGLNDWPKTTDELKLLLYKKK